MERVIKALKALRADLNKLKKGESKTVVCPLCGSKHMEIGKSAYNGHIRINCDECDFHVVQ